MCGKSQKLNIKHLKKKTNITLSNIIFFYFLFQRELVKINLESEYSTEQKGKLDLELENLKEDQRRFVTSQLILISRRSFPNKRPPFV